MQSSDRVIRSRAMRGASLCYLWLLIGFTLGTAVLLWPVRWLTAAVHRAGGSQGLENALVIVLVLAYVVVSFVLALRLNTVVCSRLASRGRWAVLALATLVTATTAWSWHNPSRMLSGFAGGGALEAVKTNNGAVFEFGAYPDENALKALKARGVTTIISLQDPNVIVEREGIEEEHEAITKLGLQLISAPMLPWFSENRESLEKVRRVAASGHGHYYVHCGLGRDRVNIVKRLIENLGARTASAADLRPPLGFEGRKRDFEQGSLVLLAPHVWLIPYPEREELYGCIFEGSPGRVVLLLDSTQTAQDSVLKESRRLLSAYGVPFTETLVPGSSATGVATAARSVSQMTPPVTVIAYRTPWHDGLPRKGAEAAIIFRDAYSPKHTWRITTGTFKAEHKPNEWTGGKESGC